MADRIQLDLAFRKLDAETEIEFAISLYSHSPAMLLFGKVRPSVESGEQKGCFSVVLADHPMLQESSIYYLGP